MEHIMLDIESLGTTSLAVIPSIGAVYFDPVTGELGKEFYAVAKDWDDQQKHGRTLDGRTVKWWLQQGQPAREALMMPSQQDAYQTVTILADLYEFIRLGGEGKVKIWGNGADFDCVLVGSLYTSYGMARPWSFRNNMCYRTVKEIAKHHNPRWLPEEGIEHHALHDAKNQARQLHEFYKALGWTK